MTSTTYHDRMQKKLTEAFQPIHMEIKDDSASHAGHAGHDPRGETHFKITLVSKAFIGLASVARHRLVYAVLTDEMQERVHAMSLILRTPDEYANDHF
ncbi:MAG: BolA family protein [Alphaproteobacteria bacterium]|nr:BolA family protein [Alphaproteobacteria bacterium]